MGSLTYSRLRINDLLWFRPRVYRHAYDIVFLLKAHKVYVICTDK